MELPGRVEAVVFDVGETLVDETRAWSALADAAGVTRLTLFATLGVLIERGEDHRKVWGLLGVDRPAMGVPIEVGDFYPDPRGCLAGLAAAGYRIGLAGNQPVEAEAALIRAGPPVSFVASSEGWGVEKPSPGSSRTSQRRPARRQNGSPTWATGWKRPGAGGAGGDVRRVRASRPVGVTCTPTCPRSRRLTPASAASTSCSPPRGARRGPRRVAPPRGVRN